MTDLRLYRVILFGSATGALVLIAAGLLLAAAFAFVDSKRPLDEAAEPHQAADRDVWDVLDQARRITRDAAGE